MNLDTIYQLRQSFIVVGLTGRIGAGCSTISEILTEDEFIDCSFPEPKATNKENASSENNQRKYKIAYNYLKSNWRPFFRINYSEIISLIAYNQKLEGIESLIDETIDLFKDIFDLGGLIKEKEGLVKLRTYTDFVDVTEDEITRYEFFISNEFKEFHNSFKSAISVTNKINRMLILHTLCNNQRRGGCYYCKSDPDMNSIYFIADEIKKIIKGYKRSRPDESCLVIIDSLRNPLEIMYFRERYSAFYMLTINPEEDVRMRQLKKRFDGLEQEVLRIDEIEYGKGSKRIDFYKQNVQKCIEKSDLHLSFIKNLDEGDPNDDNSNYPFDIRQQIVIFYSLMMQPGIVMPTPQERCMQIAYTAKNNSGCISRQVGAVITDESYSIKAIGWNNTPEGQVPCLLRSSDDLVEGKDKMAFSNYEKKSAKFNREFLSKFASLNKKDLKGHNCSYCFKDIQNSITEGKNQVHTRSLHAEENAMLQIAKYGGQSIRNGILFTTASPCELCSKKAFQLGIKKIFYIDPYPGIAVDHILECGDADKIPRLSLFTGAIGRAYHKLYEAFMPYKDEFYIRTGVEIKNKLSQLEEKVKALEKENALLKKGNENS